MPRRERIPGRTSAFFRTIGSCNAPETSTVTAATTLSGATPAGAGPASGVDLGVVSLDWRLQQVSDFSGDGRADILWRNTTTNDVALWNSNLGFGGPSWQDLQTVASAWRVN